MGGGFAAAGEPGGSLIVGFSPLVGGCRGGDVLTPELTTARNGGGGGGAVQLVSLEQVALTNAGFINVGGGGGDDNAGGGSAGTIIIEAPVVHLDGATTGLVANGGAGGGCNTAGPDGTSAANPAIGPKCDVSSAGNGGT